MEKIKEVVALGWAATDIQYEYSMVMLIMYNQRYQDQMVQTIEYYQNMQYRVELENMTIKQYGSVMEGPI